MRIVNVRQVRESSAAMQRSNSAKAVEATEAVEANHSEAAAVSTPPGEEAVTGPDWQPPKAPPPAKSNPETQPEATAESEERYISRRPEWTIEACAPYWSRPPGPRAAVHHPASVVIRRPAPRFVADPSPSVVRLPNPVAVTIRNPASRLIRNPDLTIVRLVLPPSVGIQIFRAGVVAIGVTPRLRTVNHVVAITVPAVPIVAIGSLRNLILGFLSASANGRHLAFLQFGDTLWRGNLGFPFAYDNDRVSVRPYLDAEIYIFMCGMHRDVGSIDLRLGFALIEDAVIGETLRQLNLDMVVSEICNIGFSVRSQAKNIGEVELHFSAPTCCCGNFIAIEHRLIQHGCGPIARISSLRGHIAVNHADAAYTLVRLRGPLT